MLIEHNRTAHRRTFELPCGKVVELWRDKAFIGMSRLLGVDIQVFETRADWENFRGNGNFEYPESGIKQRTRRYWLEAERKQSRELEKSYKKLKAAAIAEKYEELMSSYCRRWGSGRSEDLSNFELHEMEKMTYDQKAEVWRKQAERWYEDY